MQYRLPSGLIIESDVPLKGLDEQSREDFLEQREAIKRRNLSVLNCRIPVSFKRFQILFELKDTVQDYEERQEYYSMNANTHNLDAVLDALEVEQFLSLVGELHEEMCSHYVNPILDRLPYKAQKGLPIPEVTLEIEDDGSMIISLTVCFLSPKEIDPAGLL